MLLQCRPLRKAVWAPGAQQVGPQQSDLKNSKLKLLVVPASAIAGKIAVRHKRTSRANIDRREECLEGGEDVGEDLNTIQ
jgi:hypothetical protein